LLSFEVCKIINADMKSDKKDTTNNYSTNLNNMNFNPETDIIYGNRLVLSLKTTQ